MRKKYENPPIIEAVCEFRLTPDTQWDLTTPGLIYEKISKEFVHKEEISIQEVTLVKTPEGLQHSVRPDQRIRFLTDDKKNFYPAWHTPACCKPPKTLFYLGRL